MVIAEIFTAAWPTFESVMTCAGLVVPTVWLPKFTLPGDKLTMVPVPVKLTVCGLPVALSVIVRVALTVPLATGVKETEIVQLAPAATLDPQVLVCEKSLLLLLMLVIVRVAVPVLVRVIA